MLGRKVIGNFGAMYPLESGMVFQVHWGGKSVAIEWESGETELIEVAEIKTEGETTVNGSPIGIFWEE